MRIKSILFTLVLALMMATSTFAQSASYNPDYGYAFPSQWSIGASAVLSKTPDFQNWTLGQGTSIGAEFRAERQIFKQFRLRYIAEVPGFITKAPTENAKTTQYDRYGKVMAGISWNFVPNVYLFADAGASVNPSEQARWESMFGLAGQAGIGINTNGSVGRFYVELGADRTQNVQKPWNSNFYGKAGYVFYLGNTSRDETNLSILRNQPEIISGLKNENEQIKKELVKCNTDSNEATITNTRLAALCERLEKDLNDCKDNQDTQNTASAGTLILNEIYFDFGSADLDEIEQGKITLLARRMIDEGGNYVLDGYCSNDGYDETNIALSERRAQAVLDALANAGVPRSNMTTVGHGKSTVYDEGRSALNRRVAVTKQ